MLLAVDPGSLQTGVALLDRRTGDLLDAGVVRLTAKPGEPGWKRVPGMVEGITTWIAGRDVTHRVIEMPQVYTHGPGAKADPDDILLLVLVVGGVMHRIGADTLPRPAEWKGQVPKDVMTKRILNYLNDNEKMLLKNKTNNNHNAVDAVGLGKWAWARLPKT